VAARGELFGSEAAVFGAAVDAETGLPLYSIFCQQPVQAEKNRAAAINRANRA
jgi:hypothetical protein